jgi:hypothetical protein
MAVLSSYQWDEDFLLTKIDIARTKLILVAFAVDDDQVRSDLPSQLLGGGGGCANAITERRHAVQRAARPDPLLLPAHAGGPGYGGDALQADAAQV